MKTISPKQRRVLSWWRRGSPDRNCDAVICDGAVRSGKTLALGLSFFCWAMTCFSHQQFALCGRTIEGVRRNVLVSVLPVLRELGFTWTEKRTRNLLVLRLGVAENTFYLFGGRDESSAGLIQGITLAGVLLDEVALMPRSFVEQACARCSVTGAKFWFSCNPEGFNILCTRIAIIKNGMRMTIFVMGAQLFCQSTSAKNFAYPLLIGLYICLASRGKIWLLVGMGLVVKKLFPLHRVLATA